jgi:hypothetical protein
LQPKGIWCFSPGEIVQQLASADDLQIASYLDTCSYQGNIRYILLVPRGT